MAPAVLLVEALREMPEPGIGQRRPNIGIAEPGRRAGSRARGAACPKADRTWTNTHVNAGNQVAMTSGGDTTVTGAVV